jgi:hypothetical protein
MHQRWKHQTSNVETHLGADEAPNIQTYFQAYFIGASEDD